MSMKRREVLAAILATASSAPFAQASWPSKPIHIIVPFPPGGQTDVAARVIGQALGEPLRTAVIIDNKAGAHGFLGAAEAAKSPADGYTLLVVSTGAVAINPVLHEKMPYDPVRDFTPVSLLISVPIVLMINAQLPIASTQELVAYAKAHPGKLNYASAGNGGSSHLVAEYFKFRTGTFMTHIPFRGESPATAAVVGGQVDVMFNTLVSALPHVKTSRVKMLSTTTRERLREFPQLPTVAEALSLKDFEASSWTALYAPADTPPEIVLSLSREASLALKRPEVARRLRDLGAVPEGGPPERLGKLQRAEQAKWTQVIKAAGIKPD